MPKNDFTFANRDRAKRVFPERLLEAASKEHGSGYGIKAAIADKIGVTRSAVTRWLDGTSLPKLDMILRIADAYHVDPDYLVGNAGDPEQGFSVDSVDMRIPRDTLHKVLRLMSEVRNDLGAGLSDEHFAKATVEVLRMVERDPEIPDDMIIGAAYRLLKRRQPSSETD